LGCSAIYIEFHCRYRYTESKDAGQTITKLLIGISITIEVAVIDSSHTLPEKEKFQAEQSGYIQGNLPSFSESVSSVEKNS
jgi:hypothetical protein